MHGGPLIIAIWLAILGTSVTMVTFVIQNLISLRKENWRHRLVNALHESLSAGNYQQAWETCNASTNYLANVLQAGLPGWAEARKPWRTP